MRRVIDDVYFEVVADVICSTIKGFEQNMKKCLSEIRSSKEKHISDREI